MKKKERRRCRELDRKFGLKKGSTEWLKSVIMKGSKKGIEKDGHERTDCIGKGY